MKRKRKSGYWSTAKALASERRFKSSPRGRAMQKRVRRTWQEPLRALLNQLKSAPCADCGNTYDPVCMDFDHREPGTKRGAVSSLFRLGAKAVLAEIAKCDVVCSNCHRLRTYRKRNHETWRATAAASKTATAPVQQLDLGLTPELEAQVLEQLGEAR